MANVPRHDSVDLSVQCSCRAGARLLIADYEVELQRGDPAIRDR